MITKEIKICGITSFDDAKICADIGIDYIGFIFYPKSKRYINPKNAKNIIDNIKIINQDIKFTGVFVNEDIDNLNHISNEINLDFVQLHGFEDAIYCEKILKPYIKNIRQAKEIANYKNAYAFLIDALDDKNYGGTGKKANWDLAYKMCIRTKQEGKKFMLSGGLDCSNITSAIETINPDIVDVSSGVEDDFGIKNHQKIKEFYLKVNNMEKNNAN